MRQDQSVTVTFPLVGERAEALGLTGVEALAWTTTPWTLPTNAALAVGPDIAVLGRAAARTACTQYLLAADTVGAYAQGARAIETSAAEVAVAADPHAAPSSPGVHYDRLWDYYARRVLGTQNACQILVADYVATGEGTGIVHQAPAYGEDDQVVCAAAGIPVILSLDDGGRFLPTVPEVAGQHWFDANKPLTAAAARRRPAVPGQRVYEHSYPHCWRCRNPLIYKAVSSWFVRVPEFRDRMVELNQQINWVPENVKDGQFGKWLVERARLVDQPQPLLGLADPGVEERRPRVPARRRVRLARRARARLRRAASTDLHRPVIDELTRPNPDDPTGRSDDAPHPGRARCLVRLGLDAVRPGALPVREPRVVRQPQPGGLHRRVHRPDPRLVLPDARAVDRAVRPAGVHERAQPRHRARQRRPEDVEVRCATTPTSTRSSTATARMRCAGS